MTELKLNKSKLIYIPLGGSGRFEGNLNAYCYGGKILLIDCGIGFADDYHPGVDIILPDPAWLEERRDDIVGLVITHAHEDHVGSVGHLWSRLKCPIYATPYTTQIVKRKLTERSVIRDAQVKQVKLGAEIDLKPFDLRLINASHSTPESCMILIKTPAANVLHTGDWRLDDAPIMTEKTDQAFLQSLGDVGGVDVLVGDSTNAIKLGKGKSISELYTSFEKVLNKAPHTVVFACQGYSSLARIDVLGNMAAKFGRKVAIAGGSIKRAYDTAVDLGMMERNPNIISDKEMMQMPRDRRIFVCTGSQAEPRAALTRISYDDHHIVKLNAGDTVVFSARIIPGKEKAISDMKRSLSRDGIDIITNAEIDDVYVSGHAYGGEIKELYSWVKPKAVLPVHGDYDHQVAQADIARNMGIYVPLIPENGHAIAISKDGTIEHVGDVPTGYLAVDGERIISAHDSRSMQERRKISQNGSVAITLLLSPEGDFEKEPIISVVGLTESAEDEQDLAHDLTKQVDKYLNKMNEDDLCEDHLVHEQTRLAVMRRIRDSFGKKPVITIHIIRI